MDRTDANEDMNICNESQQNPPTIEDMFLRVFADVFEPLPALRVKAISSDRQRCLNDILMRCTIVGDCWEWQGATTKKGYGRVKIDRKLYSPHRVVAWAMGIAPAMGDPSRKTVVMHSCDNPKCCNPEHLSLGTHSENMIDCARKGRIPHQKHPWKPKPPKKPLTAVRPEIRTRGGKWILTPLKNEV